MAKNHSSSYNTARTRSTSEMMGLIGCIIAVGLAIPLAYGIPYVSTGHVKSYNIEYVWLHAKVNGKFVWMMLDTASWMSNVTGSDVHKLGLDKLSPSKMGTNQTGIMANGDRLTLKTVDVKMSVDGSHQFRTTVAIQPGKSVGNILSLHDFLYAYHGITFDLPLIEANEYLHMMSTFF